MKLFYDEVKRDFLKNLSVPNIPLLSNVDSKEIDMMVDKIKRSVVGANVVVIDNIEDESIESLMGIKPPFSNFFIELKGKNIGVHVNYVKDQIDFCVWVKKEGEDEIVLPCFFIAKISELPRFYAGCFNRCEKYVESKNMRLLSEYLCKRGKRTAELCHLGKMGKATLEVISWVVNQFYKKPQYIRGDKNSSLNVSGGSKTSNKKSKRNVIYINNKVSVNKGNSLKKGSPKSPHTRRGHYRHYKNGKVVWVKESKVKGGKNRQKIFRVK